MFLLLLGVGCGGGCVGLWCAPMGLRVARDGAGGVARSVFCWCCFRVGGSFTPMALDTDPAFFVLFLVLVAPAFLGLWMMMAMPSLGCHRMWPDCRSGATVAAGKVISAGK